MGEKDLLGTKVGHIRIVDILGKGGMGSVFVGYDERLERKVALKAIHEGRLTAEAKARFQREARILSQLQHPNICLIHDYVESEDRDFLVLELIEGTSLKELLTKKRLDASTKARIAEQIVRVLIAAHEKGIIHRDLKPSNVMLTTDGTVKVLDFGLARAVEPPPSSASTFGLEDKPPGEVTDRDSDYAVTKLGTVVGTLMYMSPEQARGEPVTPASDMYSLGLLLQELYTGQPPYDAGLRPAAQLEKARAGETRPVTGQAPDLTALINRLKSSAPGARPSSFDAAQELRRIIDGPRRRRRRRLVAAVWVALLLLSGSLAVQTTRAVRQARRAAAGERQAEQVSEFLVSLFQVSDPSEARGRSITALEVLSKGAQSIEETLEDQPLVQARLMATMGRVFTNLGLYSDAERLLEQAVDTQRRLLGHEHPDAQCSIHGLADLRWYQSRPQDAEVLYRELVEVRTRTLGEEHPLTLQSRFDLASTYHLMGRKDEASRRYLEIVEAQRRVLGEEHTDTLKTMNNIQNLYYIQRRYAEAEEVAAKVFEGQRRALGKDHPETILAMYSLGTNYWKTGNPKAETTLLESCRSFERVLGETHPRTLVCVSGLAAYYRDHGDFGDAEALLLTAHRAAASALGEAHRETHSVVKSLVELYGEWGKPEEAAKYERLLPDADAETP